MAISNLERLIYGVEDLGQCATFWSDFGLHESQRNAEQIDFETDEGTGVSLRSLSDPRLPKAPEGGQTVRETVWGVSDQKGLREIAARLADLDSFRDAGSSVHAIDPGGHAVAFEVSQRRQLASPVVTQFNSPNAATRVNRPATLYPRATPQHLAHIVYLCPELDKVCAFYRERLGFRITDSYPGHAIFLQCPEAVDHHNLYLLKRGSAVGFHHVAFDLRDIHELFAGGLYMQQKGWPTFLGPGRHPVSSAYFWYFRHPGGGAAEYDFDTDVIVQGWKPRELVPSPELFAEWALPEGIERYSGVQKTRV